MMKHKYLMTFEINNVYEIIQYDDICYVGEQGARPPIFTGARVSSCR